MRRLTVKLFTLAFLICLLNGPYYSQQSAGSRAQTSPLFPFINALDGKIGFIDAAGKVSIQPQFETFIIRSDVHPIAFLPDALGGWKFSEGLARVRVNGSYGFINEKGELVIAPRYVDAGDFSGGLARVKQGEKYGFINPRGDLIIRPAYDKARDFSDGLAAVAQDGRYSFIDTAGKMLTDRRFEAAGDFSEGFAAVLVNGRYGFIDKSGTVVIEPRFEYARPFSEGRSAVKLDGKYGFIDKKGSAVIAPQFIDANDFSEGLARVKVSSQGTQTDGYIDADGRFVIQPQFSNAGNFSQGLAWVRDQGFKYGYIDKRGEFAIKPAFEVANDFAGGLALVSFGKITKVLRTISGKDVAPGPLKREPGAQNVNYTLTNETVVYGYVTPEGKEVFRGVWLFEGQIPNQAGPLRDKYGPRSKVDVPIATTPTGATVYIIPFLIWDTTPGLIDDARKLFTYRQTTYTTKTYNIAQDVYIFVLEHSGRKCAVRKDVNQYNDRAIELDFSKESQCRKTP